ncbi:uncharacterized protein LOC122375293 [Amphibalanus amphitrite]|uniref:uncharacterized protein LOC122375293 n=1 Tax=Amphibalanus amphitrite TaxID=1232801 RepID=UPI001C915838|nr:uncharacterized protein LOC122375293 [Amphibalanus amphitrite]
MLSLEHILKYLDASAEQVSDGSRRCLVEGESIVNSNFLLCCGIKAEDREKLSSSNNVSIFALCMQTSKMSGQPHEINILLKQSGEISTATCSCKAGLSGTCKHIVGCLLFVYRTTVAKLEVLGCTDVKLRWKELGMKGKAAYAPCKVSELCHVGRSSSIDPVRVSEERSAAFFDLIKAAPSCSVSRHVRSRPVRQGEKEIVKPSEIHTIISNTMSCDQFVTPLEPPQLGGEMLQVYESKVAVDHEAACRIAGFAQGSEEWMKARDLRITGSKCYELYTHEAKGAKADWVAKLGAIERAKGFAGNAATRYGQKCEGAAIQMYEGMCEGGECIVKCGLLIPPACPWLGFSPDAVVVRDGKPVRLVEVKSPVCGKKLSPLQMLSQKSLAYVDFDGENGELRKRHQYYGQVQLGMAILAVDKCDFVIYGKDGIAILPVYRDPVFQERLLQSLRKVFFTVLLPQMCRKV